jgi:hypothetical protein
LIGKQGDEKMNDEIKMSIPETVGEMIDFLKKFPRDFNLDFFYRADWGEAGAYDMNVLVLDHAKGVEITIK